MGRQLGLAGQRDWDEDPWDMKLILDKDPGRETGDEREECVSERETGGQLVGFSMAFITIVPKCFTDIQLIYFHNTLVS